MSNSIIEEGTVVEQIILENSLIGRNVHLCGQPIRLNLGDSSSGYELVECRAGFIYPQTPVAFTWHDQRLIVEKLIAEWRTPDGWKFRVLAGDETSLKGYVGARAYVTLQ